MKKLLCLLIMGLLCMGAGAETLRLKSPMGANSSVSTLEKEAVQEAFGIYQSLFPNKREDALVRDFAQTWTRVKKVYLKLKKNEFLNWEYQIDDEGDKNLLMKRAQKGIKEYKNYAAYYNAAVVAFGNRNWEGVGPTDTDLANVVLYSGKAMELGKAHTAPEMYLLRAEARMRQLDFMYAAGAFQTPDGADLYAEQVKTVRDYKKEFRPILADLEIVWKKNPGIMTHLLDTMSVIYAGLGDKESADKFAKLASRESGQQTQKINKQKALAQQEAGKMFRQAKESVSRGHFRATPAGAPGMFGIGPSK